MSDIKVPCPGCDQEVTVPIEFATGKCTAEAVEVEVSMDSDRLVAHIAEHQASA